MYICICHQVTSEKIQEVIKQGKRGKEALKALGVGSECGLCLVSAIEQMGAEFELSSSNQSVWSKNEGK